MNSRYTLISCLFALLLGVSGCVVPATQTGGLSEKQAPCRYRGECDEQGNCVFIPCDGKEVHRVKKEEIERPFLLEPNY